MPAILQGGSDQQMDEESTGSSSNICTKAFHQQQKTGASDWKASTKVYTASQQQPIYRNIGYHITATAANSCCKIVQLSLA
nr:hypothetical protein Itr_chr12CG13110 [Ipomoea trifida]